MLRDVVAPLNGHGLIFPVGEQVLFQGLVVFVGDFKGIVLTIAQVYQVVCQPVGMQLNGEVGASDALGGPADQLLVVINGIAHGAVDSSGCLVTAHHGRHALGLPIYLSIHLGAGDINIGAVAVQHPVELLDALGAADLCDSASSEVLA